MSIRYVTLNGQIHEISSESLRGLGEWGWDISQDVIALNEFHTTGTEPPGSGTYEQGNVIWNSAPVAGGNVGWICTGAGSPGTWMSFGVISAVDTTTDAIKLDDTVSPPGWYNVLSYGILRDTNGQEVAINALIQTLPEGATLYFPPGNYRINVNQTGNTGIILKSNMNVVMADGCVIQAQAVTDVAVGGFALFRLDNKQNVTIRGGILDGNRKNFNGYRLGESCCGIYFESAKDCFVYDTIARNFVGDGFLFQGRSSGGVRVPGSECRNVWLYNCQGISNARNGVFYGGAINCGIIGGEFRDTYSYAVGEVTLSSCSGDLTVTINGDGTTIAGGSYGNDDAAGAAFVTAINNDVTLGPLYYATYETTENVLSIYSHPSGTRGTDVTLAVTGTGLTAGSATFQQYLPAAGIELENEKIDNAGDEVSSTYAPRGFLVWDLAAGAVSKNNSTGVVTVTKVSHGLSTNEYVETEFHPDDAPAYPFYSATWDRSFGEDKGKFYNHVYQITVTSPDTFTYTDLYSRSALGTFTNTKVAKISQINNWRNRDLFFQDVHCHHNQHGLATWGRVPERISVKGGSFHDNMLNGIQVRVGASKWDIEGAHVYGNGNIGIKLGNTADMYCYNLTVRGCKIHNNAASGMTVDKQYYARIENNDIHDNGEHGIWARLMFYSKIDGNIIRANGTSAADTYDNILLYDEPTISDPAGDSSYNTFSNNYLNKGANTNKPAYGVNIDSAVSASNKFFDNIWLNAGNVANFKNDGGVTNESDSVAHYNATGYYYFPSSGEPWADTNTSNYIKLYGDVVAAFGPDNNFIGFKAHNVVTTTGVSEESLIIKAVDTSSNLYLDVVIEAYRTGGASGTGAVGDVATWRRLINIQRVGSAAPVIRSIHTPMQDENAQTWTIDRWNVNTANNTLYAVVKGAADTNITWTTHVKYSLNSP